MRNFLFGVVILAMLLIGLPLFFNYQNTGDVMSGHSSIIVAVADSWLSGLSDFGDLFRAKGPGGEGTRFG